MNNKFYKTTKHQIAEIMFNFAMRLCEDNEKKAIELINKEKDLIGKKPARELSFCHNW